MSGVAGRPATGEGRAADEGRERVTEKRSFDGGDPRATVRIIVVNWNGGTLLGACLASLAAVKGHACRIEELTVVDNGSTDGSLEGWPELPFPLRVLRNPSNLGFARACNQGAAGSRAPYLLFLNPDTRVSPDALDLCAERLSRPDAERVALLGARLVDDEGRVHRSCANPFGPWTMLWEATGLKRWPALFPGILQGDWPHDEDRHVNQVCGAFFWMRRPVFEELGGFDEDFFLYFEDCDLCLRIRDSDRQILFFHGAEVHHARGGCSRSVRARRLYHCLRSKAVFARKHLSFGACCIWGLSCLGIEPVARLVRALLLRDSAQLAETLGGYGLLMRHVLRCLTGRRKPGSEE